ncbi:MAG TPA: hypothetical protein VK862_02300 [Afifellaceae bacterium]|nr:hypothetical protein [Afifellaceae bacterium]
MNTDNLTPGPRSILIAALAAVWAGSATAQVEHAYNDYPTVARADYVFACMAANGQTRDVLEKCSCSIDIVASILPYDKYVEAEAVLQIVQVGGEKTSIFRTSRPTQDLVGDLRRAQMEAELRCF